MITLLKCFGRLWTTVLTVATIVGAFVATLLIERFVGATALAGIGGKARARHCRDFGVQVNLRAGRWCHQIIANFVRLIASALLMAILTTQAHAGTYKYLACAFHSVGCLDEVDSAVALGDKTPLILIHGYYPFRFPRPKPPPPRDEDWKDFISYFDGQPDLYNAYKLYRFSYVRNYIDHDALAHDLRDVLDKVNIADPQKFGIAKISIVAHSLGGLVARRFMLLKQLNGPLAGDDAGERVVNLITLGTPHHGTQAANRIARDDYAPGWAMMMKTLDLFSVPSDVPNRFDLHWDNFDGIFKYGDSKYSPERNAKLETLNRIETYDKRIIAYAGSIAARDYPLIGLNYNCNFIGLLVDFYACGTRILHSGFYEKENDGIVPAVSALLIPHHGLKGRRLFQGYDHSELFEGHPGDTKVFDQIRRDLTVSPPAVSAGVAVNLPPVGADLKPQSIMLSPTTLSPGASFTANWSLANSGSAAANAASTTVVRINQSPTKATGTNLQYISTSALGAGFSVPQSASLFAPIAPGRYYVWVIADNYSAVTNQNDTSNDLQPSAVFTVTGPSADLIPLNITPSSTIVTAGASFTANWTLANTGAADANATSMTVVRINQSTTSAAPIINLAGVSAPALAAGAPFAQIATLTAPTAPGTYYVWVIADNFSEVTNQINTTNDLRHSAAFTVLAATNSLQVTPAANLVASGQQGGPFVPSSIAYQLSASSGIVNYSISVNYANPGVPNWINITPATSGEVGTTPVIITAAVNGNAVSLLPGTYSASINFTNTANGQVSQRTATLTITEPPAGALQVSQGDISFSGPQYGPFLPGSFSYQLSATNGSVDFSISNWPSWLTPSTTSGTVTTSSTTVTFWLSSEALTSPPGTYGPASIAFTNSTNGQGNTTRNATLTVNPIPTLQVLPPDDMVMSGSAGGPFSPPSFQFQLSSTTGSLDFTIDHIPSWLTASRTSGTLTTSPTTVTFTVNDSASSLPPGGYTAIIDFNNVTTRFRPGSQTRFATLTVLATGTGPSFQGLGFLPGGGRSRAFGVSADGKVAVGEASSSSGQRGFRRVNGTMTSLGVVPGGLHSEAFGVNSDGAVVVGDTLLGGSNTQAFRWASDTISALAYLLPGDNIGTASAVNSNGTVVVGISGTDVNGLITGIQAVRWVNGSVSGLGFLPSDNFSAALGVNSDGTVIVGYTCNPIRGGCPGSGQAFRWSNGTMTGLGNIPGGWGSAAYGVNSDGTVVVGFSYDSTVGNTHAFRWTATGGMANLGISPGNNSTAYSVNADGSVVVGSSNSTGGGAFRWTAADGEKSIAELLTSAGVNFTGWTLDRATGVSADGTVIVGYGRNTVGQQEGWIARLPLPAPALQVSPATDISASGNQGGPFSPSTFSYQLRASSGSIDYTITNVPTWLTASSESGTVDASGITITFTVNSSADSLASGTYNPLPVVFTNASNGQGNTTRAATLVVNAPPPGDLQVTPSTGISAAGVQGGPFSPSSFSYQFSSTSGSIDYSISGVPTWLSVSSTSGTVTTAGTTIDFTVNASANSLSPGIYDTTVTFANTTNDQGTQTRAATLTVAPLVSVPPDPTATAAASITSNSFTANWSSSGGATGYRLDVSADSTFSDFVSGYHDLDAGNSLSSDVSGLSPNTTYYYRLRAYNSAGTSGDSNIVSQQTLATYTITVIPSSDAGGTVGGGGTFDANSSQTVTATPNSGYAFVNWTENGTEVSQLASFTFILTSNRTLVANFEFPEFQVNTYTANAQSLPSIAGLSGGGFVVTWQSYGQDGSSYGVYGQRYAASGVKTGGEFRVNTYVANAQSQPSVAGLGGGGFVVTWQSAGQDGSGNGVYGQRYTASGTRAGLHFRVNTYRTNSQAAPSVAGLSGGGFVVTWHSAGQDGSSYGVYGQRYAASGVKAGREFRINAYKVNAQSASSVAGLGGGGFVVTWQSNGQDGSSYGVYGQRYTASGVKAGGEFRVNTFVTNAQSAPSATGVGGGGFVVTWQSTDQDGSGYGVYGQRYTAFGVKSGGEFPVNSYTANAQSQPSVAGLSGGGFVVTWQSNGQDGSEYGIYGQLFD